MSSAIADHPIPSLARRRWTALLAASMIVLGAAVVAPRAARAAEPVPAEAPMCTATGGGRPSNPLDSGVGQTTVILGDAAYFGGAITSLRDPGGGPSQARTRLGACSIVDGSVLPWAPQANDHVWSLVTDGTWIYAGGEFTSIGGKPRAGLARIDPVSGAVADGWAPSVGGGRVMSLLVSGGTLYVGGSFTQVNGQPRTGIAALDLAGGSVRPWAPKLVKGTAVTNVIYPTIEVRTVTVWRNKVVVAGHLSEEGVPDDFGHIAAFDAATAESLPWAFKPNFPVLALGSNSTSVFAGGAGHGPSENSVTRIDPVDGSMGWQVFTDGNIQQFIADDDRLIVAGHMVHVTGAGVHHAGAPVLADRNRLMILKSADGALTDFDPGLDHAAEGVWGIATDPGQHVLVATGEFGTVSNRPHNGIGRWTLPFARVAAVSPASANQGAVSQSTVLTGAHLAAPASMDFGPGVTAVAAGGSGDTMTVALTVAPSAPTGARDVRITEPDGEVATCVACFAVQAAGSQPSGPQGPGQPGSGGTIPIASGPGGYLLVASDGGIFAFGDARFHGSTGDLKLAKPIVGMAQTPTGAGYWLVASDGGIFAFGDAAFRGSTGSLKLSRPIVGMASTPSGAGYWLVASDGGIFAFGDAAFRGSTGSLKLSRPIVGMASTPSGNGYWLVASDGGIFAFGDAAFRGSTGSLKLARPIVTMTPTRSGRGYWLVASDGGIFAFGDATFRGSTGSLDLARPIIGMATTRTGSGYWLVASDGGIFAFGDALFKGSTGAIHLARPIVGVAGA